MKFAAQVSIGSQQRRGAAGANEASIHVLIEDSHGL